jgi:hypothetical protein
MKPYPFTHEHSAWLHDLETTTEPQTVGALHRVVAVGPHEPHRCIGWCPLGRGAVVLGLPEASWGEDSQLMAFSGSSVQLLPYRRLHLRGTSGELLAPVPDDQETADRAGREFQAEGWQTLAEINDELRWTFPQIAAYIRAKPWNVFTAPDATHAANCPHARPRSVNSCSCGFYKLDFSHD